MCSMFSPDLRDSSGTYPGTTNRNCARTSSIGSACFDCGLQGIEVPGDQDVASDLISRNCHRIHLQKFGVSTFLNVQETVSHACQLHSFSPVLHPLLSEIMMGNESQTLVVAGLRCSCNRYGNILKGNLRCMGDWRSE